MIDPAVIEAQLRAKAREYLDLAAHLAGLASADPRVAELRRTASDALAKGDFDAADAALADAERARSWRRRRSSRDQLDTLLTSAAETRAVRAAAARLRLDQFRLPPSTSARPRASWRPSATAATWRYLARGGVKPGGSRPGAWRQRGAARGHQHAIGLLWIGPPGMDRPDDWAMTQNNLGNALRTLGERESGTARLEEAVAAYRAALEEWTRERVPLDWAMTQNNLGNALWTLGERESGTARLEEAVAAYRAALEEWTRERVPLDWAMTQNNLGTALQSARRAGERDGAAGGGGRRLSRGAGGMDPRARAARLGDDAEQPRQRAPERSGERESGTARLEEAVAAYRAALEERTRERVPLDWAMTQNNLGNALADARRAGERHGAAGGGGRRLSRGAGGDDPRARAARLGDDAEQSRQRAPERSASGRAARRGSRRRSPPIARRWRSGPASACRSTGR